MIEHAEKPTPAGRVRATSVWEGNRKPRTLSDVDIQAEIRFSTGMGELNRVLGGGAVAGSLVLVGGAPGIGKSTLLLQICACLCKERRVLYASGEESERQLKLRAQRLNVDSENLLILSETRLGDILEAVEECKPDVLIADSIQTLYSESNESAPGSISQVKDCTMSMMQLPRGRELRCLLLATSTKKGPLRAPKSGAMLTVSCTLKETETGHIVCSWAVKNRFGSTNEIGVV